MESTYAMHSIITRTLPVLLLPLLLFFSACTDSLDPSQQDPDVQDSTTTPLYSFSGTIANLEKLPDSSRLVILWSVSSGNPDYAYLTEAGTINRQTGEFLVTIYDSIPSVAVNNFGETRPFGVGVIAVVDMSLPLGVKLGDDVLDKVYGAINNTALINLPADPEQKGSNDNCRNTWLGAFPEGLNLGVGVEKPEGCSFDGFAPTTATGLQIQIWNNPNEFIWPNWT